MPQWGPVPLPYEDVLDISMYSAEEIGDEKDILASFDDVSRAYGTQFRMMSRRQAAATWQLWD